MDLYLKKYFWVVTLFVIAVCAVLSARAVNHVLEAKYLLGDAKKKVLHAPRIPTAPRAIADVPTKDAEFVSARNVFCLTCEPPKPEVPATGPVIPDDPLHPQATSLPLVLLATAVSRNEEMSSVSISNSQTNRSGSYWLHEFIPDAGEIVSIRPRWVDFRNKSSQRVERLDLLGIAAPPPPPPASPPIVPVPGVASADPNDISADVEKGVHKIDDTHYDVDRALVDKLLLDPSQIMRSARIVPSIKDGKANGFKMYAIRPNSVYAKIGMQNGDTIQSINGFEITSPDKALEVYTKVKSANSLSVQITRRGQPVSMDYQIK
jgi:general secretion pathway protein C